eukprot:scaffold808_cov370-Prasinococcus_capsulatus_cf.AAC.21
MRPRAASYPRLRDAGAGWSKRLWPNARWAREDPTCFAARTAGLSVQLTVVSYLSTRSACTATTEHPRTQWPEPTGPRSVAGSAVGRHALGPHTSVPSGSSVSTLVALPISGQVQRLLRVHWTRRAGSGHGAASAQRQPHDFPPSPTCYCVAGGGGDVKRLEVVARLALLAHNLNHGRAALQPREAIHAATPQARGSANFVVAQRAALRHSYAATGRAARYLVQVREMVAELLVAALGVLRGRRRLGGSARARPPSARRGAPLRGLTRMASWHAAVHTTSFWSASPCCCWSYSCSHKWSQAPVGPVRPPEGRQSKNCARAPGAPRGRAGGSCTRRG